MGIFCNAISGASAQCEGVQRAKSEGKYRGRSQTALAKTDQVIELLQAGKTPRAVARELEISVRSVWSRFSSCAEFWQTLARVRHHPRNQWSHQFPVAVARLNFDTASRRA